MPWPKGRPCPPETKLKIASSMIGKNIGNPSRTRHGATRGGQSPEYICWQAMKRRCIDPKRKHFSYYGGRGVTVCDRWLNSFENFLVDMGTKPSPKHSIDRYPNRDGNYEPTNCRWATKLQQVENRANARTVSYSGKTILLSELCRELNLDAKVMANRLNLGWPMDRAISTPVITRAYHPRQRSTPRETT